MTKEISEAAKAKASTMMNVDEYVTRENVARFIQQVSDAAKEAQLNIGVNANKVREHLAPFILPEPVDQLQEALRDCDPYDPIYASAFREALAKRGLKIVEDKS